MDASWSSFETGGTSGGLNMPEERETAVSSLPWCRCIKHVVENEDFLNRLDQCRHLTRKIDAGHAPRRSTEGGFFVINLFSFIFISIFVFHGLSRSLRVQSRVRNRQQRTR